MSASRPITRHLHVPIATIVIALAVAIVPTAASASPRVAEPGLRGEVVSPTDPAPSEQFWYLGEEVGRGNEDPRRPRPVTGGTTSPGHDDWPPTWPDEFTTGASCEVACIRWGRAHDNGSHTSVYLNVKTTTPVLWELHVTNDDLGYADTRAELTSWTTQAHATYTDLEAATTYDATVTVRDQWGNVEQASGSFTTSP